MLKLLEAIINLWFDQDPENPDNYQMWTQSANLKNLRKEILGTNACKESGVKRKISATIVESIRRPFGDAQQEEETVDSIRNGLELVSNQKLKSFWSAQLLRELRRVKRMREGWHKIMSMVCGRKRLPDTYLMEYDEFNSRPLIGRMKKVVRHFESPPVSSPFPVSNIFPGPIQFPISNASPVSNS